MIVFRKKCFGLLEAGLGVPTKPKKEDNDEAFSGGKMALGTGLAATAGFLGANNWQANHTEYGKQFMSNQNMLKNGRKMMMRSGLAGLALGGLMLGGMMNHNNNIKENNDNS